MKPLRSSRYLFVFAGIFLAVLLFLLVRFFGGISSGESPEDLRDYFDALNAEGQNSPEKIDQAFSDGSIDLETALLYKIYAVFGDDRLPEVYQSTIPFRNSTSFVREMNQRWDSLSDETKTLLAPYRKRPDEEGSWMNLRYESVARSTQASWIVPHAHAERASAYSNFLISADGKVKIWYPNVSGSMKNIYAPGTSVVDANTGKAIAKRIKGFLDQDKIISRYETLLGKKLMSDGSRGGDSKYDIYVAPCGGDLGLTFQEFDTPTPSYIIINYGIGLKKDNVLKTTLAHELFHGFQYTYDFDVSRDNWWSEATAVWSEDFIYPSVNSEHGWLKRFLWHPATSVFKELPPKYHHYATYLLAYFATENFGDDFMKKSWE